MNPTIQTDLQNLDSALAADQQAQAQSTAAAAAAQAAAQQAQSADQSYAAAYVQLLSDLAGTYGPFPPQAQGAIASAIQRRKESKKSAA